MRSTARRPVGKGRTAAACCRLVRRLGSRAKSPALRHRGIQALAALREPFVKRPLAASYDLPPARRRLILRRCGGKKG